jgi:2,3-bisphosphoglycerate-dependent phosphoglycerate mutase
MRAHETAQSIAKHHENTPLLASEMLREWNIGIYTGTPYGTIFEKMDASGIPRLDYPIEGGETINEFKGRVERAMEELRTQYQHDTIIVVTHGGFIQNALLYLLDLPDERFAEFDPENTGVAYLTLDDGKVTLHYLNDTTHLEGVGRSGETTFLKKR